MNVCFTSITKAALATTKKKKKKKRKKEPWKHVRKKHNLLFCTEPRLYLSTALFFYTHLHQER